MDALSAAYTAQNSLQMRMMQISVAERVQAQSNEIAAAAIDEAESSLDVGTEMYL